MNQLEKSTSSVVGGDILRGQSREPPFLTNKSEKCPPLLPALRSGPLLILNIPCAVFQILSVEKSARLVACSLKKFDPGGLGYDEG